MAKKTVYGVKGVEGATRTTNRVYTHAITAVRDYNVLITRIKNDSMAFEKDEYEYMQDAVKVGVGGRPTGSSYPVTEEQYNRYAPILAQHKTKTDYVESLRQKRIAEYEALAAKPPKTEVLTFCGRYDLAVKQLNTTLTYAYKDVTIAETFIIN